MINMQEISGNIWKYHDQGEWVVITTNGMVKNNGECVMGRGVALQATQRYPTIAKRLGSTITKHGNRLFVFKDLKIITFPVKHHWKEAADLELIQLSAWQLMCALGKFEIEKIYVPRPGCGNGKLDWEQVRPVVSNLFDGRVIITNLTGELPGEVNANL